MSVKKKDQHLALGAFALVVLAGFTFWVARQTSVNLENMARSNRINEALLDIQARQTREYSQELLMIEANLSKTETLLGKVQEENVKLHEKIALLDRVVELEQTIFRLKEKNARLINQMSSMEWTSPRFSSVDQGKSLLDKYRDRIRSVHQRIKEITRKERVERLAAQRELDRIQSELGNNGFLVRNGTPSPLTLPSPIEWAQKNKANKTVKVDVTFVK